MTEGELAGKPHHHVPGLAGIGEIQNDDQNGEQIIIGEPGRREQCGEQQRKRDAAAARHSLEQPAHGAPFPKMPCGRNSSTNTSRPKENMLLAEGVKRRPASASVSPISTPPSSAPGSEP